MLLFRWALAISVLLVASNGLAAAWLQDNSTSQDQQPSLQKPTERPLDKSPDSENEQGKKGNTENTNVPNWELALSQLSVQRLAISNQMNFREFVQLARERKVTSIEVSSLLLELDEEFISANGDEEKILELCKGWKKFVEGEGKAEPSLRIERMVLNSSDSTVGKTEMIEAKKWMKRALVLGCSQIAVTIDSSGSYEQQKIAAVNSLSELCSMEPNIHVLAETRRGLSVNPKWLQDVIGLVKENGHNNCGLLLNFARVRFDPQRVLDSLHELPRGVVAEFYAFRNELVDKKSVPVEKKVPYKQLLDELRLRGFHGLVSIRYLGPETAEKGIENSLNSLRAIRESEPVVGEPPYKTRTVRKNVLSTQLEGNEKRRANNLGGKNEMAILKRIEYLERRVEALEAELKKMRGQRDD